MVYKSLRLLVVLLMASSLSGCFYWWRAYQTYEQLGDFDEYFKIEFADDFKVSFKEPRLYSDDIVNLAHLRPSEERLLESGEQRWRYIFRKINQQGDFSLPEVEFYCQLDINQHDKVAAIIFSPLFLHIAPPEFLALSFRSLGAGKIDKGNRQLKVSPDVLPKTGTALPLKADVVAKLGKPISIEVSEQQEAYLYHFKLEAYEVDKGYEKSTLSVVKLWFDKQSHELSKMSGQFAGLKISINYQNYKL